MTAQISDSFLFQDKKFSIAGIHGAGLFNPVDRNLQPLPRLTSCWRGFVCTYKTHSDELLLDSLQINLEGEGPALNNTRPIFPQPGMFNNGYSNLELHMDFTGGILIATGFIQQLYVHMGFHPAWKYETVFELTFSQGNMLETRDVSLQMSELRQKMTSQPAAFPGTDASGPGIDEWIASTFTRSYRF
jgi:hypothetical protein